MFKVTEVTAMKQVSDEDVCISITGEGFATVTAVYFVHLPTSKMVYASSFKIVDDKQVDAVVPKFTTAPMRAYVHADVPFDGQVLQAVGFAQFLYIV
ncbi:hypothetical protein PAN31117_02506 [Pandoraea anapnoica]|uniref:IPT/TIG domain-containing protein n=1 Tax=Pandoraea anapnoica TaxID=2508301 RepID=A0A5E5A0G2_9BURK|nr:hypothetical protein [Pandoraea anapnoica]VVE67101.1 hypothetical protein PAN31117_02506 [Pandoraea anapnoica]